MAEFQERLQSDRVRSISLWGINYAPEKTGIGPQTTWLAQGLVKEGYDVRVVCAFSYYPAWLKNPKDKGRIFRSEVIDDVKVQRNWLFVPKAPSLVTRTIQQASFVALSALRILFSKPSDLYVVVSPPFLLSPAMRVLSFLKSRPYVVHLQDDEVGAAYETTNLGRFLFGVLKGVELWGHRGARAMSTISDGMQNRLNDQLTKWSSQNIALLANRVAVHGEYQVSVSSFRDDLPAKRLLVYSGNLGDKQVLNDLIPAVCEFSREELIFYICGMGAQKEKLKQLIETMSPNADNIVFGDLLPDNEYQALLASADACVLSEMAHTGKWLSPGICFASKMLSYMTQKKALFVYAGEGSEAVTIVNKYRCGFALKNGQPLAELLREFVDCDNETLQEMGENGQTFYHSFTTRYNLEQWIEQVTLTRSGSLSRADAQFEV